MSQFIGTWIEHKCIDYEGWLKIIISIEDGEVFVKAVFQYPDDLPKNRVTIPIESVNYEKGELVTYSQNRSIDSKPKFQLVIKVDDGRLKVTEYMGAKGAPLNIFQHTI